MWLLGENSDVSQRSLHAGQQKVQEKQPQRVRTPLKPCNAIDQQQQWLAHSKLPVVQDVKIDDCSKATRYTEAGFFRCKPLLSLLRYLPMWFRS